MQDRIIEKELYIFLDIVLVVVGSIIFWLVSGFLEIENIYEKYIFKLRYTKKRIRI